MSKLFRREERRSDKRKRDTQTERKERERKERKRDGKQTHKRVTHKRDKPLQLSRCSSEASPQSSSPSHSHECGRQRPLSHWNWCEAHTSSAPNTTRYISSDTRRHCNRNIITATAAATVANSFIQIRVRKHTSIDKLVKFKSKNTIMHQSPLLLWAYSVARRRA